MKKRLISLFCIAAVLVAVLSMAATATEENVFRVGYHKIDINPEVSLPLRGFGNTSSRMSDGKMDDNGDQVIDENDGLFATCIAVTDKLDNTMLFISIDMANAAGTLVTNAREAICTAFEKNGYSISNNQIMIAGTHTHSAPDLSNSDYADELSTYRDFVVDQLVTASLNAMEDRCEATMSKGEIDASESAEITMNSVRHYNVTTQEGKTYVTGDNFGPDLDEMDDLANLESVSEANDTLYLLQFTFAEDTNKTPILLANWRGHPSLNSATRNPWGNAHHYKISSDYINAFRWKLEQSDANYRVAFFQAAAGNINPRSALSSEWGNSFPDNSLTSSLYDESANMHQYYPNSITGEVSLIGHLYGWKLAAVAMDCLDSEMKTVNTGEISSSQMTYMGAPNAAEQWEIDLMETLKKKTSPNDSYDNLYEYLCAKGTKSVLDTYSSDYPELQQINSRYHLNAIESRAGDTHSNSSELNVIRIGEEVAFVTAPNELYDRYDANGSVANADNDWLELNNLDSYGTPFVLGYCNSSQGYIPNTLAYSYNENSEEYGTGSYETNTTTYGKGSGEEIIAIFKTLLDPSSLPACEVHGEVEWTPLTEYNAQDTELESGHYYLATNIESRLNSRKVINNDVTVCLYLNGKTFARNLDTGTNGRAFNVSGTLNIMGEGTIQGQGTSTGLDGGTIQVLNGGTLNLYNGTIRREIAESFYSPCGGVIKVENGGNFHMMGGTVTGGVATEEGDNVYVSSGGTFSMSGGTIAGGVYIGTSNPVALSGSAKITGATDSYNMYLVSDATISVDSLADDAQFGITALEYFTDTSANAYADRFVGDNGFYVGAAADGLFAGDKFYCECGGKAEGVGNHVCKNIPWAPWSSTTSLPDSGNYYLTQSVTISDRKDISNTLRLDLSGNDITRMLTTTSASHALRLSSDNAALTITDSTNAPGTVKRDWTTNEIDQSKITHYGLLVNVNNATSSFTLYNGTLDSTGASTTGAGTAVSANVEGALFRMYGGSINGGHATKDGGVIYAKGYVELYGGTVTGGTSDGDGAGVYTTNTGSLLLSGNASVTGNYEADDTTPNNIHSTQLTVRNTYTGTAGIHISSPAVGTVIGLADNANITGAALSVDGNSSFSIINNGTQLVLALSGDLAAYTTNGSAVTNHTDLQTAFNSYPGGDAVITLLKDIDVPITITKDTILDLGGHSVVESGSVTVNDGMTLSVKDSNTDDYTAEDSEGYGKLPANSSIVAADGYQMITEGTDVSFHRLNLRMTHINLRPDPNEMGMYYTSQFGGDEVLKEKIQSYGVALSVAGAPTYDKETGSFDSTSLSSEYIGTTWTTGAAGSSQNGTLLRGIMDPDNGYTVNKRNANMEVYGRAYVVMDDRVILGDPVSFSFRDIIEGNGLNGAEQLFNQYSETEKSTIVQLYNTYEKVMRNWTLPNIEVAVQAAYEVRPLKVLMIGHSLGVDSMYLLPEVAMNEGTTDITVGVLYHSGCRLSRHVTNLETNRADYAYFEFNSATDTIWRRALSDGSFEQYNTGDKIDQFIDDGTKAQTMQFAIEAQDWDIVILQAGTFEATNKNIPGDTLTVSNIGTIMDYVLANDMDPSTVPEFAWNMTWTVPSDPDYRSKVEHLNPVRFATFDTYFNGNAQTMHEAIASTLKNTISTQYHFSFISPTGTAMLNAILSLGDSALYRDNIHASDYGRVIAAYTWYCTLTGKDVSELNLSPISCALRFSDEDRATGEDLVLTEEQKNILRESVKNALATPYSVTQITN